MKMIFVHCIPLPAGIELLLSDAHHEKKCLFNCRPSGNIEKAHRMRYPLLIKFAGKDSD